MKHEDTEDRYCDDDCCAASGNTGRKNRSLQWTSRTMRSMWAENRALKEVRQERR